MNKQELRKLVGRGRFSIAALADAQSVTYQTARKRVAQLADEGIVELVGVEPHVGEDGTRLRGRPVRQYRVVAGK